MTAVATTALLNQQEQELVRLTDILEAEYEALKQRQHNELLSIAQQKSQSLQLLEKNDKSLRELRATFSSEEVEKIESLKAHNDELKAKNERNGKLLALLSASHSRLTNLMMPAERRAGATYTKQGQKHHAGRGNCHFAV